MKALIFGGSGKIGSAIAWDLSKDKDIDEIGIVGRNQKKLEEVKNWIGSDKVKIRILDIDNKTDTISLMKQYDAAAITLPDRRSSYKVVQYAIEAGLNIVDALEEFHRTPDPYETEGLELPKDVSLREYGEWLHEKAVENGVTFVDGMGFAPGLSNITVGEGIRKMDVAEKAIARVGGIPSKEAAQRHPLRYMITWAFEHVLREYMINVNVIKNGKVVEVPASTELEEFRFNKFGKDEVLECAITPGMPSFLFTRPWLREFAEKTVRWPGHWEGIQVLKECGMLDIEPVDFEGKKISPRKFLSAVLTPKLLPNEGETDVCVMYNTVEGKKDGRNIKIEYSMWEEANTKNNISAMMRVTGFPIAITTKMLLLGKIKETGIVAPEDAIKGDLYKEFLRELNKRDINILEEITEV
ncbi:MAG TPA: saccharopine dehydrogenase C-terminal domain-containing protein [Candidatus Hydrothermia bacterium]|nr:saccharopine dehydrogenase NADP-binding domain-containing protein [Candidatus Hydrothermae bacterium]MDD3648719.1 saccharopine dehydrogenase C-terminal domain-containing protein [Candidatus Hydrothermia bacterium]HRD23049.1 saccharopine dehydrogenase C-terminal domain-containing protein [Candidatus Hydrothermia bacterium]